MDPDSLVNLCTFGADVGTRLVKLAAWVDGMPSTVKSLGFEIWAACEVLCELSMITARAGLSISSPFFNPSTLQDIRSLIQTFDEVIHEAARGVLVSYERVSALGLMKEKQTGSDEKEKICLSFQERSRWPLFQHRIKIMMEALVNAKLDLTLHILVYWVVWEAESRRKSKSSIFGHIRSADRASIISQLWTSKVRRDQEMARTMPQPHPFPNTSLTNGSGAMSILALSYQSERLSHTSDTRPESRSSMESSSSALSRMKSRLARASSRRLQAMGLKSRKDGNSQTSDDDSPQQDDVLSQQNIPSRQTSSSTDRSQSSSRSGFSDSHSLRSGRTGRPGLGERHQSMISWDSSQIVYKPGLSKAPSWTAGPTRSAKEGIAREWESLQLTEDVFDWNNEEGELGHSKEPRELGRKLLFAQLDAQMPYWVVLDAEGVQETGEMLVGRWIESGRVRRRMVEWEDYITKNKVVEPPGKENLRFHFTRA